MTESIHIRHLQTEDIAAMRQMLNLFGQVFEDLPSYCDAQPDDAYLRNLLASDTFIALTASNGETIVGGLAAYVWPKFEQARKEIYIYDLAVHENWRRRGIATQLIQKMQEIAKAIGAYVVMVQAEPEDEPAVALYSKLGSREDILSFDLHLSTRQNLKICTE